MITALALALFWHFRPAPRPDRATPSDLAEAAASTPDAPERLKVKVLSVRPHDPEAFTQGLLLDGNRSTRAPAFRASPACARWTRGPEPSSGKWR